MKLLLVGEVGLVQSNLLRLALADSRVSSAVVPTRQQLLSQRKLQALAVNFVDLPEERIGGKQMQSSVRLESKC